MPPLTPQMTPLVFQVLALADLNEVYDFAEARLREEVPDENERMFRSWDVRWKKEALEHYLKLGWSFVARREGKIAGFFLGQPFLFFRGHTQTLWIEHFEAQGEGTAEALCEVAIKVAREKNLQRVLFSNSGDQLGGQLADQLAGQLNDKLKKWSPVTMSDSIAEIKTTK